jgi:uncharacterized protein YraI
MKTMNVSVLAAWAKFKSRHVSPTCIKTFAAMGVLVLLCPFRAEALNIEDRVQCTANLNVRGTPSTSGTLITSESSGSRGIIVDGPQSANGYTWWKITWDNSYTGWSVQDYLSLVTVYNLNIASSNPNSGVYIYVGPNDILKQADGTTAFLRYFDTGTSVTLVAPQTAGGNNFQKWQLNGSDLSFSTTVNFAMSADYTLTAVYAPPPPPTQTLTVSSSNPNTGVSISGNQPDNNGNYGGGTTFSRVFNRNATVSFNAPSTAGVNMFQKWTRDGVDFTTSTTASITMDSDHTITAIYTGPPPPTLQTLAANLVGATTATLNGSYDSHGLVGTINFEYGLTTAYGNSTPPGDLGPPAGTVSYAISDLTPNTLYHFRVVGTTSGGPGAGNDMTFTTSSQTPTAQTLAATVITATSAQLNGALNPNGSALSAYFEYGSSTGYGNRTLTGNFGTAAQNISFNLSGLNPNTVYHYRVVASTRQSSIPGLDQTFTTSASGAPGVQTLAATAVTTTSAQLNGSVDPSGYPSTVFFEYGLSAAYGSSTPPGSIGTSAQHIQFTQNGLAPNTTYHYRIVAQNSKGTIQGLDSTFATLPTAATAQPAWVAGTSGLGLRLRTAASFSSTVVLVIPEGSQVDLLGETQTAEGYLWRHLTYASQSGWAAAQYLVFTPGSTPTPPVAPGTLKQLQSDGFSPIAAGAAGASSTVTLAATPLGASASAFTVQFEVRPSGTVFSGPTTTASPVQSGTESRVVIGPLANQGYHWRARALDGNGVPSEWVAFSSDATDFSIGAVQSPIANFTVTPSQIFTGDAVTFAAQEVGQPGLTFSWDIGGASATGATTTYAFSQSGDVTVTLTVTDSSSNQSHKSVVVSIASKNLVDRINAAAGQSSSLLDDVLANVKLAADAADYFNLDLQSAPTDIEMTAALTAVSLLLDMGDNDLNLAQRATEWAKATYGDAAASRLSLKLSGHFAADEIRSLFVEWAVTQAEAAGEGNAQLWAQGVSTLVAQKKSEITQLQQQAIAAAGSLTPAQSDQFVSSLQARLLGNYALRDSYVKNANLPISFKNYKSGDESGWTTYNIGQYLFSFSADLGVGALGLMAGPVAPVAAKATQAELDIFDTLSSQSAEAQLFSSSLQSIGQGPSSANLITLNIESALKGIVASQTPVAPPTGRIVTIDPHSVGTIRTYNLIPHWFATKAWADVTLQNTGQQPAVYRIEAFLTKTFATGRLPIGFAGIGERQYEIDTAVAQDEISLTANQQRTVTLTYLSGDGGQVPEGQDITYVLTARTSDGCYRQDSVPQHFGTTYTDENGNPVDSTLVAAALISQNPIRSSLLIFPGSNVCQLNISVQNPLETLSMLTVNQELPSGATVMDSAGGTLIGNGLNWELDMQPGQFQLLQVNLLLPMPLSNPPLTNTTAVAYDSVNATWLPFSQAPLVAQIDTAPPPILQSAGFGGGGFTLGVKSVIPGVYRVEMTSDLSHWNDLVTVTNTTGRFQVSDPGSAAPQRFYRVFRQ